MFHAGTYLAAATVRIPWNTSGANGASITRATNGTVAVWKDGGLIQSSAGVTDTEDFDGFAGMHVAVIDTSADGTFYSTGSEFMVGVTAMTIDGLVVNAWIGGFRLGVVNSNVTQWLGTAPTTPGTAGVPNVDLARIVNAAVSTSTAQLGVNAVQAGAVAWGSAAITAASIAAAALNGKGDWNIGKTGYALSAAGVQAIWDALTSALTAAGSIGKLLVDNINATVSSRMATYTQPTGFLAATFPAGTVANTTNITAGTITTATNLTTNNDKTGYALSAAGVTAIWAEVMEGTRTAVQFMRGFASVLLGKLSGAATATNTIRDIDDTKARVTASVDSDGNRSAITLDLT